MPLWSSLPASAEGAACQKCSWGLNTSGAVTLRAWSVQGGGSRERRHGAALESLAQRSDALGGVVTIAVVVDATECVVADI